MFRVFQSVRGLADDSVTRLDKNEDLALEMRDLTKLHWARNFKFRNLRSKGDFQRRQHRSSRPRSRLAWRISGLIHGVWGLWTTGVFGQQNRVTSFLDGPCRPESLTKSAEKGEGGKNICPVILPGHLATLIIIQTENIIFSYFSFKKSTYDDILFSFA